MIRIGVLCPAEIALRRFMPALNKCEGFEFVGVGVCSLGERFGEMTFAEDEERQQVVEAQFQKAQEFVRLYGGKIYKSYCELLRSDELDAVYIPLPPALHYKWAKYALEHGKHVLLEKPFTLSLQDSCTLVELAERKGLALHENYMFAFHNQIFEMKEYIEAGKIGVPWLYRISFGFPRRAQNDFRYNKSLGGGALFDCGGYTIKYASMILKDDVQILCAQQNYGKESEVDIFGSGMLCDREGTVVQIAFGMDNDYKCELEVWGSKGTLKNGRVLTAPAGFIPHMDVIHNNEIETIDLPEDDSFEKSVRFFENCVIEEKSRKKNYADILKQARLVEEFCNCAEDGR